MKKVTATLIKLTTDDGLFEIWEDVPLGKKYQVDLDRLDYADGYNTIYDVPWKREIIFTTDGEWLPTEILDFDRTQGN